MKFPSSPPPLPPPRGQTDDVYSDVDYGPGDTAPPVSDTTGVRLTSFTNDHQADFPVVMEVTTGFLNTGEDCSMSEGEQYVVHFIKQTKVITMQDEQGERFNIPLNTPFEFGLIHDPNNNLKEALSGFIFKTAGDIMLTHTLPKAVRARKSFRGISPEHSVEMNDLLLVKELVQKEGELRYLRCFRAVNGDERHLHDNCLGEFLTSPYDVRMMLPDIVKHFQLPLKAVFYTNTDIEEEIPTSLVSSVVTISTLRTEESLITTALPEDENEDFVSDSSQTNEIPLAYDIKVTPVAVRPMQTELFLKTTEELFENYDPSTVYHYLPKYSLVQYMLWKATRTDQPMAGIELVPPPTIAKKQALIKQSPISSAESLSEIVRLQVRLARLEADHVRLLQSKDKPSHYHTQGSPGPGQDGILKMENRMSKFEEQLNALTSAVTGVCVLCMCTCVFLVALCIYNITKH